MNFQLSFTKVSLEISMKIYIGRKFWLLGGDFHPDPRSPEGILKIPEGSTPCPRAVAEAGVRREAPNGGRSGGPRARRAARGDFQNPRTGDGDLVKIHDHKPEFCTYFFS